MEKGHTLYRRIVTDITREEEQGSCTKRDLDNMDEKLKAFKVMIQDTFGEQCDFRFYTLKYLYLYRMVEDIRMFKTLSALDCRSYEHLKGHINHCYVRALKVRRNHMTETMIVL